MEKIIHLSILFLLVVALMAMALPGMVDGSTATLFKTTVFQIAVEVAFVLWIFLAARREEFRVRFGHPVILFFLLFVVGLLIALPFSDYPSLAFWSTPDRVMGVFHYLHLAAFLVVLAGTVRTWCDWKRLLVATTLAAVFSDVVAIQDWLVNASGLGRAQGAFVNTLFLAQYTAPHLAIAGILIAKARNHWERAIFGVAFVLHTFVLALTASRAAVLALLAAAIFGALVFAVRSPKRAVRFGAPAAMAAVLALLIAGMLFLHAKGQAWTYDHMPFAVARMAYPNQALEEGKSLVDVQIGDRGAVWMMGLNGFLERPIAGHGFEHFRSYFDRRFDPTGSHAHLIESNYDRVHNQFIDVLFSTGLLGSIPYALFWASLFLVAHRRFDGEESAQGRVVLFMTTAAFVMAAVQLFFLFDVAGGAQILILLAAFLYFKSPETYLVRFPKLNTSNALSLAAIPVAVLMVPILWRGNVVPMQQLIQSVTASEIIAGDVRRATELFEDSVTPATPYAFWLRFVPLNLTRVAIDFLGVRTPVLQKLVAFNVEEQSKSVETYPDVYAVVHAAAVAHRQAAYFFPNDAERNLKRAEELAYQLIELGPGRVEGYEELGDHAVHVGDAAGALQRFREARERVLWNDLDSGRLDMRIAQAHVVEGNYAEMLIALDSASRLGYSIHYDVRVIDSVISRIPARGDVPEAFDAYVLQFASLQPSNFDVVQRAAEYFLMVGDREKASASAKQLYVLDAGRAAVLEQADRISRDVEAGEE